MSLDQKIGQLIMVSLTSKSDPDGLSGLISTGRVTGAVLLGSGWTLERAQAASTAMAAEAAGQPAMPFVAIDQEGGAVQRLAGAGFDPIPSASVQGTWTAADLTAAATTWGRQLRQAGVNLNLAPVADTVPPGTESANVPVGSYGRQFGSDPGPVGTAASAFVAGMTAGGVQSCVKHFPGLGRVGVNPDVAGAVDGITGRGDPYLEAFRQALAGGAAMVMMSSATYSQIDPGHVAALSPVVIGQVLRGDLGWGGVVLSDDLDAGAVRSVPVAERAVDFIGAGGDIAMFSLIDDAQVASDGLRQAAADPAFVTLIDAAATRVLRAKLAAGLLTVG